VAATALLAVPHAVAYDMRDTYTPRTDGSAADRMSPELLIERPINAMRDDPFHLHQLGNALPQADVVPPPRSWASLSAIDAKLYLFGGVAPSIPTAEGSKFLNDLHMFDTHQAQWTGEISRPWCCVNNAIVDELGARPSPRAQHGAAVVGSRVYVFGGLSDRMAWNEEPTARRQYSHYVSHGDELYLNDMHYLETGGGQLQWSGELAISGRPPLARASHATLAVGSTIYVFGGRSGSTLLNDLYAFDTVTNTWSRPPNVASASGDRTPCARHYFGATSIGSTLYVFGGLYQHNATTALPARSNTDPDGFATFEVTDASSAPVALNDLQAYDTIAQSWKPKRGDSTSTPPSPPPHRYATALIGMPHLSSDSVSVDSKPGFLALMGGVDGADAYARDDMSVYNVEKDEWHRNELTGSTDVDSAHDIADAAINVGRSVPSVVTDRPPARYGFAWATENGRLYEFGGIDAEAETFVNDLYMYHQSRRQDDYSIRPHAAALVVPQVDFMVYEAVVYADGTRQHHGDQGDLRT